jgi:polyisoprenyl-teichoic acid--peptidoglycan teichoic acid transferase
MIWQTALAIVLGVLTGVGILTFTHKRPAEATTKPPFASLNHTNNASAFAALQLLPRLQERMTVLVMGVDSNGRNTERITGCRSDTMILVSMDPVDGKVGVVSIPRDSRVQISGNHGTDKINSAHAFGGPQLAVQTVSENFCVPIDHYVVVDTQGLKGLSELLGPVEVLVEKEMHYHDWAAHLHIDLKPGLQVLDPGQVEQYVRFRHDAKGDIGRIERQQWFFRQAANKLKDPQFLLKLPDLIKLAYDNIQTDLSIEDMARIACFAKDIKPETVVTAMLPGQPQMINGGSYWVPDIEAGKVVFNRILGIRSGGNFVDAPAVALTEEQIIDPELAPASASQISPVTHTTKPMVVALKYSKGSEKAADQLERLLVEQGYRVRYKWLVPAAECAHEQIVQLSGRADDFATESLKQNIPDLAPYSVVLQLEPRPYADFTVVLTPSETTASETHDIRDERAVAHPIIPD